MKDGWLLCLDADPSGDITRSGIVWSYDKIAASVSTVAISDGLVYAAGFDGRLHCLDAETGRCYWVHEAGKPIWGSPLVADGRVYWAPARRRSGCWPPAKSERSSAAFACATAFTPRRPLPTARCSW